MAKRNVLARRRAAGKFSVTGHMNEDWQATNNVRHFSRRKGTNRLTRFLFYGAFLAPAT